MTITINIEVRYLTAVNDMPCNVPSANSPRYAARSHLPDTKSHDTDNSEKHARRHA